MSGGLPPSTAVESTVTMLSPPEVYLTVTSGLLGGEAVDHGLEGLLLRPRPDADDGDRAGDGLLRGRRLFGGRRRSALVVVTPTCSDEEQDGEHETEQDTSADASCVSFRSVVDAKSRVRVEEMQRAGVYGDT